MVLHDARNGRLFQLNQTAAHVWCSLRDGKQKEAIVDDLTLAPNADPLAVGREVEAFVDALRSTGLVEAADPVEQRDAAARRPARGTPALDAVYRVGEVAVRVMCYPADVAAAFSALAAPAVVTGSTPAEACLTVFRDHNAFVLTRDNLVVEKLDTAPGARWALVRQLVSMTTHAPCLALLHAGAIATPAGCVLICGESGAGKSTLLASLVHAGFGFVADDLVPLEGRTGRVWPVRLAISIKQGSWPLLSPLIPDLAASPIVHFGGRTMRYLWPDSHAVRLSKTGCRVAAAVFPRHAEDAPAMLSPLDPVRSLALLGEGGSVLPSTDVGLAEFLAWWSSVPAHQLTYGRLEEAIAKVVALTAGLRQASQAAANAPPALRASIAQA